MAYQRVDLHSLAGNFLPDRESAATMAKAMRSKMTGAGGGTAAPAFVKGHPWRNEEIS
jgi:hypothetical protein